MTQQGKKVLMTLRDVAALGSEYQAGIVDAYKFVILNEQADRIGIVRATGVAAARLLLNLDWLPGYTGYSGDRLAQTRDKIKRKTLSRDELTLFENALDFPCLGGGGYVSLKVLRNNSHGIGGRMEFFCGVPDVTPVDFVYTFFKSQEVLVSPSPAHPMAPLREVMNQTHEYMIGPCLVGVEVGDHLVVTPVLDIVRSQP